ncbi:MULTISPECIES: hypothetical protein [unclassified Meiothermus]|uniref:hypothetical protein n=1 Tax=unclassified Meiothermus TaxID=370471 RepID=UPI000D7BCC08|nr:MULTISPECIES: hypothetical protein [unclassified Meiothermus]PZA07242.1 hypothetical protein DNA98_08500 [Meiothermus sp. Pnk-1]RYM37976.1 hypothetical protein EWH23_05165 [Meiothermus sp. PNK-Is4]
MGKRLRGSNRPHLGAVGIPGLQAGEDVKTTKPTIDHILAPKPALRPRIYAYSIADAAHAGLSKVGVGDRLRRELAATVEN